jgi:alpha-1,3-glucosyltransferase
LGSTVALVFAVSFGPFISHLPQILSRLFPFKRGLLHSYWAANIWALYSFVDRLLIKLLPLYASNPSLTRGIVGDVEFSFLPNIQPWHTLVLTVLSQMV